jgi:predicted DNA binding protein/DNA-binding response OmpR family regulator
MSNDTPARPADDKSVVLVIDDDKDLADTYALWLNDEYEVRTAYSGMQAQEALADDLDVVLLDRRMPGIPGDQVLAEIRDRGLDCQVAMLTAVEPDSDIVDQPFDEYMVKPVTREQIRETVEELLLRAEFDEEAQEFFAIEATEEALETRDPSNLRDPSAVDEVKERAEAARESEQIQQLKGQLSRLQRISSVIRDIDQQLVLASSREEIEETVCERLVESEPYGVAWIGNYTESFNQLEPRHAAGISEEHFDTDRIASDGEQGNADPIATAVNSGDPQLVPSVSAGATPGLATPVDAAALDDEYTCAVIPLRYRDTVYGVLNVYSSVDGVFDDKELSVLGELGRTIANAINAVNSKKLMLADTVVTLEFSIHDADDVFVDLSKETESRIELEGFVPTSNGDLTCYVEVVGTTAERFLDAATRTAEIDTVRGIDDTGDDHLYECRVTDSTIVLSLVEAGANVGSMVADQGNGEVTAQVAPETDVRTVVESINDQFPESDLTAKREEEWSIQSVDSFRKSLENKLTERQYAALKATYSAGYFDWPRGSTAKQVAESLDLAPPTLHEHLRGAQRKLIESFFDEVEE